MKEIFFQKSEGTSQAATSFYNIVEVIFRIFCFGFWLLHKK